MISLINRRVSRRVDIAHLALGGDAPILVQSMTNTDTADIEGTIAQVHALARAGSEVVRVTVNTSEAAAAVPHIRERLDALGCDVPLVGDFHFNGHKLLTEHPACAEALAKYRINPGNVGRGARRDEQFGTLIELACRYGKPVRIGVNWGSLDQALLALGFRSLSMSAGSIGSPAPPSARCHLLNLGPLFSNFSGQTSRPCAKDYGLSPWTAA